MIDLYEIETEVRDIEVNVYRECMEKGTHLFNRGGYLWVDENTGEKLVQCKICCCMVAVGKGEK